MRINELFDKPLKLSWTEYELGDKIAFFKLDDVLFKIEFESDKHYNTEPGEEEETTVKVTFNIAGKQPNYMTRNKDATTEFKHKTSLIFATVKSAIDYYFSKETFDSMHFSSSDFRQTRTYNMMMKYINNDANSPYHISTRWDPGDDDFYYEIIK